MEFPAKGKLKYIVFEEGRFAVVFPSFLNHDEVEKSLGRLMFNISMYGPPTSAGYCRINREGRWVTYADSVTLGLKSEEGDEEVLEEWYPTQRR
jgi:hypothetical protein